MLSNTSLKMRQNIQRKTLKRTNHRTCRLTREDKKALALLEKKKISLEQVRRSNKLKNVETKILTFNFNQEELKNLLLFQSVFGLGFLYN